MELAFLSHDVRLAGRGLIGLVNALQKFAVEWIAPLPARYRNLIDKTDPAIDEIEIKQIEKSVLPVEQGKEMEQRQDGQVPEPLLVNRFP